jgi:outer membrane cobalamin receptor
LKKNKLTANTQFAFSEISSNGNQKTYLPNLKFGTQYHRELFDNLNTSIGMIYVGERYGDIENEVKLESYIDLNAEINYDITKSFNIFLKMNNLLNQDIYIWENYKRTRAFCQTWNNVEDLNKINESI